LPDTRTQIYGYQAYAGIQAYQAYAGIQAYQTYAGIQAYQTYAGIQAYQAYAGIQAYQAYAGIPASGPERKGLGMEAVTCFCYTDFFRLNEASGSNYQKVMYRAKQFPLSQGFLYIGLPPSKARVPLFSNSYILGFLHL
jgi:hypothetical protein